MSNFSFLSLKTEYALFAPACVEAEKIYALAMALCAVGCRKTMELIVVHSRGHFEHFSRNLLFHQVNKEHQYCERGIQHGKLSELSV